MALRRPSPHLVGLPLTNAYLSAEVSSFKPLAPLSLWCRSNTNRQVLLLKDKTYSVLR